MKKLMIGFALLLFASSSFGWEPEEYLVYIDTAAGTKLKIGNLDFLHSVRIKKVGTKQLWLLVVNPNDVKFKQKAKAYIQAHPELDIQYWKSWKEMYLDTTGMGRTCLEHVLRLCYDFDSNPETPDTCEWIKDVLNMGYTWQQIVNNKERILYPIALSVMDME